MVTFFIELAGVFLVTFFVSYISKLLKQPLIVGYIVSGMLISPFLLLSSPSGEIIRSFSNFGIAFLLFIVGLHLNPKVIKQVGLSSTIIAFAQMILTFLFGFVVSELFFHNYLISTYIGIAVMFSSTIVVTKLISDSKQLDSLYGKITIGILILQDIVAIIVLMFISSIGTNTGSFSLDILIRGLALLSLVALIGLLIVPHIIRSIANSQELLFLFAISWAFVVAAAFSYLNFSIEVGALIAGIILSVSPYAIDLSAKVRSLRDFFLVIFFVILGLNLPFSSINSTIIIYSLILSGISLLIKPSILIILTLLLRFKKRTSFATGIILGQISTFSLIIISLGVSKGQLPSEILSIITLTLIITIAISTYLSIYLNKIYPFLSKLFFFIKTRGNRKEWSQEEYEVILFGYNRTGLSILNSLKKMKEKSLVVDFNPEIISNLEKNKIPHLYGDAYDTEFLDELNLKKIKLIISTIPDFKTNYRLINYIRKINSKAIIIVKANKKNNALELYQRGADYVLITPFLGGEYLSRIIKEYKTDPERYKEKKKLHIRRLLKKE